jgi:hypothetical protein
VTITYKEIHSKLSERLNHIVTAPKYKIRDLTEGKIKSIFGEDSTPIEGVFLISNHTENKAVYVGRSRNMASRIGVDLRATTKQQANLSYKLMILDEYPELNTIPEAREFIYNHFSVQMIKVNDENERAVLQIYAAMELGTIEEFNSFKES